MRTPTESDARRLAAVLAPQLVDLIAEGNDLSDGEAAETLLFDRSMKFRRAELVALLADMTGHPRDRLDTDETLRWRLFKALTRRHRWQAVQPVVMAEVERVTQERVLAREAGAAAAPGTTQ